MSKSRGISGSRSSHIKKPIGKPGLAVVLSSPSGTGKTTICHALLRRHDDYQFSVSATTRPKRWNERDGVDYIFMTSAEFKRSLRNGEFVEHTCYLGNYYATPRRPLEAAIASGRVILLDIDVRGGLAIKKALPAAVLIFLVPPTLTELRRRLAARRTEDPASRRRRLAEAAKEINIWNRYDYLVVNDDLEEAVGQVEMIIEAERLKTSRLCERHYLPAPLRRFSVLKQKSR